LKSFLNSAKIQKVAINFGGHAMEPNQENLAEPRIPSMLTRSMDAFYRNLPELLKKHYGKWVAYHGDECVGIGRSQTDLYQKCLRRGLPEDEFEIFFLTSQALYDREETELPFIDR
jgi:hypothetical protein